MNGIFMCVDSCPKSNIQKFNERVIDMCKKETHEKMYNEVGNRKFKKTTVLTSVLSSQNDDNYKTSLVSKYRVPINVFDVPIHQPQITHDLKFIEKIREVEELQEMVGVLQAEINMSLSMIEHANDYGYNTNREFIDSINERLDTLIQLISDKHTIEKREAETISKSIQTINQQDTTEEDINQLINVGYQMGINEERQVFEEKLRLERIKINNLKDTLSDLQLFNEFSNASINDKKKIIGNIATSIKNYYDFIQQPMLGKDIHDEIMDRFRNVDWRRLDDNQKIKFSKEILNDVYENLKVMNPSMNKTAFFKILADEENKLILDNETINNNFNDVLNDPLQVYRTEEDQEAELDDFVDQYVNDIIQEVQTEELQPEIEVAA